MHFRIVKLIFFKFSNFFCENGLEHEFLCAFHTQRLDNKLPPNSTDIGSAFSFSGLPDSPHVLQVYQETSVN